MCFVLTSIWTWKVATLLSYFLQVNGMYPSTIINLTFSIRVDVYPHDCQACLLLLTNHNNEEIKKNNLDQYHEELLAQMLMGGLI